MACYVLVADMTFNCLFIVQDLGHIFKHCMTYWQPSLLRTEPEGRTRWSRLQRRPFDHAAFVGAAAAARPAMHRQEEAVLGTPPSGPPLKKQRCACGRTGDPRAGGGGEVGQVLHRC